MKSLIGESLEEHGKDGDYDGDDEQQKVDHFRKIEARDEDLGFVYWIVANDYDDNFVALKRTRQYLLEK